MTIQIRGSVFETNSSSSHSVTVSSEELADDYGIPKDVLRSGVIRAHIAGHYGWEWHRYYTPGGKIAYLATQLAGGLAYGGSGKDVTAKMRQNTRVDHMLQIIERRTGCRVEIIGASSASVDHDSIGVGLELLGDENEFLRFVFGKRSYVETGNDNSSAPMTISTDLGDESYLENRYVQASEVGGQRFEMTLDMRGSNVFMHPEGGQPIYANVDDQADLSAFVADLDGLVIEKVGVWSQRPDTLPEEHAADDVQEFVHEYLNELTEILPSLKIVREASIDSTFDVSTKDLDRWDRQQAAHFTLFASAEPEKVARMAALLSRHSGMAQTHP
ncbi:hypothetical protein D3C71_259100 [compost metagenome]